MYILLAEDDNFFQHFYLQKLKESGIEVDVASNGSEAIQKLLVKKPDLLLLDLIMPNKDGFEVLAEIAKHEGLKGMPVLVFSTLGQESDIEKAKNLGAAGYVNKSFFDFENLLNQIKSTIQKNSPAYVDN